MRDSYKDELHSELRRVQADADAEATKREEAKRVSTLAPPLIEPAIESAPAPRRARASMFATALALVVAASGLLALAWHFVGTSANTKPALDAPSRVPNSRIAWAASTSVGTLIGISAVPSGPVEPWLVGSQGVVYASGSRSDIRVPEATGIEVRGLLALSDVAKSRSRAVAVGVGGAIARRDDEGHWAREDSGTRSSLNAIDGGIDRMFAVGEGGVILRNTGAGWKRETPDANADLFAVSVSAKRVIAVGASGAILMRDQGGSWAVQSVTRETLRAIYVDARDRVMVVGDHGTVLVEEVEEGNGFKLLLAPTTESFRSVTGYGQRTVLVGDGGNAWLLDAAGQFEKAHLGDSPLVGVSVSRLQLLAVSSSGEVFTGSLVYDR